MLDMNIKDKIIHLLKEHSRYLREIAQLRFELEEFQGVTDDEMLEALVYARGSGEGRQSGTASNKTPYIAMNYHDQAEKANAETIDEILRRLAPLEKKTARLDFYLSMLPEQEQTVIKQIFFAGKTLQQVADRMSVSTWAVRRLKASALGKLEEMYAFLEDVGIE